MLLNYNALKIDEIERIKKMPIEQCIGDSSISNIALFVQKGMEDMKTSVSKEKAFEAIDEYLKDHDKDDLILDIMDALIQAGFLSREINLEKIRENKGKIIQEAMKTIK